MMILLDKIKYTVKWLLACLLYYSGFIFVIRAIRLKNRTVVLMYHRVLTNEEQEKTFSHPGIIVDRSTFTNQMACLKRYFNVITEDELIDHMTRGRPLPKNACLITFDDGWLDNYTNAYPILRDLNLPATIFLTTGYIGTEKQFWQEKLSSKLFNLSQQKHPVGILEKYYLEEIMHLPPSAVRIKIRDFVTSLKKLQSHDLEKLLTDFVNTDEDHNSKPGQTDVFLDWNQVKKMARNYITFGSHTANHLILTKTPLEQVQNEMLKSYNTITNILGTSPKTFCYPNGGYTDNIAQLVAAGGYLAAFSTQNGFVDKKSNLFTLPRIGIHNDMTNNTPMFMARILGLL